MDVKTKVLVDALGMFDDLGEVTRAVVREQVIRDGMAETGEDRQTVADFLDAAISMGQEAVLDLVDGEPTTLNEALQRYVERLNDETGPLVVADVVDDLDGLLAYPWPVASAGPGREMEIRHPDDEHLEVWIGGQEVASANHDEHGWSGMAAVQATAEAVHRALNS